MTQENNRTGWNEKKTNFRAEKKKKNIKAFRWPEMDVHILNFGQTGECERSNKHSLIAFFTPDGTEDLFAISLKNVWSDAKGYQNGLSR